MQSFKGRKSIFCALILLLTSMSCKKFIDVGLPQDQVVSDIVFSDDSTATSAMVGLYHQMMGSNNNIFSIGLTLYCGLSADEIVNSTSNAERDQLAQNALAPNNSIIGTNIWRRAYNYIYHSNYVIEGLDKSAGVSPIIKNRLKGEALFVRALCYFYMVNLFSDIPLVLTSDYKVNAQLPRTKSSEVYLQIVEDLKKSQGFLSATYPTANRARPNKWTATALLARTYLYMGDWKNAEIEATSIITSGTYTLLTGIVNNNVFGVNSNETIWQIAPVTTLGNTWEGSTFLTSSTTAIPQFVLRPGLLTAFESADLRKSAWIKTNTPQPGQPYSYPQKYRTRTTPLGLEYYVVFRLAEQYLIRAEARAQQENLAGAKADIDIIRVRAGLTATGASTKAGILSALMKERQIELFCEWGHRWFDIKRTLAVDGILGPIKPGWQSTDALYPIPENEINSNPFLVQNPGY